MPWGEYLDAQLDGIEETASLMESTWAQALVALLVWEAFFRDEVRKSLLVLPTTADGHFDTRRPRRFVRYRTDVQAARAAFVRGASIDLAGLPPSDVVVADPARTPRAGAGLPAFDVLPRREGVGTAALRDTRRIADRAINRARRLLARDRARARERALVPAGGGGEEPGAGAPETARGTPDDGPPESARGAPEPAATPDIVEPDTDAEAAGEDLADATTDLLMNVWGNLGNEARRATEQLLGLTTRFGRRKAVEDFLDRQRPGRPGTRGWHANRGILRKSVVEHLRAHHRRRTLTAALKDGHGLFRLDVPKARLGKVDPQGALGKELWRVRGLPDWEAVMGRENRGRVAASDFAGLGLGHGDVSFITAVPDEYRRAAEDQGRALRDRYLRDRP